MADILKKNYGFVFFYEIFPEEKKVVQVVFAIFRIYPEIIIFSGNHVFQNVVCQKSQRNIDVCVFVKIFLESYEIVRKIIELKCAFCVMYS